jgi:hypothetical protein
MRDHVKARASAGSRWVDVPAAHPIYGPAVARSTAFRSAWKSNGLRRNATYPRDPIDFEDARLLLSKLMGDRGEVWAKVEPFLLPGRETTACYAFEDIWESRHVPNHSG